jgi:hypothetical protein
MKRNGARVNSRDMCLGTKLHVNISQEISRLHRGTKARALISHISCMLLSKISPVKSSKQALGHWILSQLFGSLYFIPLVSPGTLGYEVEFMSIKLHH